MHYGTGYTRLGFHSSLPSLAFPLCVWVKIQCRVCGECQGNLLPFFITVRVVINRIDFFSYPPFSFLLLLHLFVLREFVSLGSDGLVLYAFEKERLAFFMFL